MMPFVDKISFRYSADAIRANSFSKYSDFAKKKRRKIDKNARAKFHPETEGKAVSETQVNLS